MRGQSRCDSRARRQRPRPGGASVADTVQLGVEKAGNLDEIAGLPRLLPQALKDSREDVEHLRHVVCCGVRSIGLCEAMLGKPPQVIVRQGEGELVICHRDLFHESAFRAYSMFHICSHMEMNVERSVTLPVALVEKLIDTAARAKGVNDSPTLMMFAEVRLHIEQAKRKS